MYNMLGVCLKIIHPNIRLIYHVRLRKTSYVEPLYNIWVLLIKKFADEVICVSNICS